MQSIYPSPVCKFPVGFQTFAIADDNFLWPWSNLRDPFLAVFHVYQCRVITRCQRTGNVLFGRTTTAVGGTCISVNLPATSMRRLLLISTNSIWNLFTRSLFSIFKSLKHENLFLFVDDFIMTIFQKSIQIYLMFCWFQVKKHQICVKWNSYFHRGNKNVASDQGLHCLLTGISIKIE